MPPSRALAAFWLAVLASPAFAALCPLSPEEAERRIVSCKEKVALAACRKAVETVGCAVVRELKSIHAIVVTVPRRELDALDEELRALKEVESVEGDPRKNWLQAVDPLLSGTLSAGQPSFRFIASAAPSPDPELPWGVKRVGAPEAWARGNTGQGIAVCVVDTGVDASHPDLRGAVIGGRNVVEPGEPFGDEQGHGTHVAGSIAAAKDGRGVAGVAPGAKILAAKVLDAEGNGNYSDVIAGLEWCVERGAPVINMSLGADEDSAALRKAVQAAARAGSLIVAAAGNSKGGPVSYPAAYPETLAVSASLEGDGWAGFSSLGPEVDFIAPGGGILSTVPGGSFAKHSGTSMAAPHVAGLAALAARLGARGAGITAMLSAAAARLPELSERQQGQGMPHASRLSGRSELIASLSETPSPTPAR